jgi:hypothetical protein
MKFNISCKHILKIYFTSKLIFLKIRSNEIYIILKPENGYYEFTIPLNPAVLRTSYFRVSSGKLTEPESNSFKTLK